MRAVTALSLSITALLTLSAFSFTARVHADESFSANSFAMQLEKYECNCDLSIERGYVKTTLSSEVAWQLLQESGSTITKSSFYEAAGDHVSVHYHDGDETRLVEWYAPVPSDADIHKLAVLLSKNQK